MITIKKIGRLLQKCTLCDRFGGIAVFLSFYDLPLEEQFLNTQYKASICSWALGEWHSASVLASFSKDVHAVLSSFEEISSPNYEETRPRLRGARGPRNRIKNHRSTQTTVCDCEKIHSRWRVEMARDERLQSFCGNRISTTS